MHQEATIAGFRLSPRQASLWAAQQLDGAYRSQAVVRLAGKVEPEALRAAIEALVGRHEILRTTFHRRPGMKLPLQVVSDKASYDWRFIDLSSFIPEDQDRCVAETLQAESRHPFEFEQGPLIQATLVSLSADRHLLLLGIPTLCADTRSLEIISQELKVLYADGGHDELAAEQPLQYADFSEWHNQLIEGDDDDSFGEAFWEREDLTNVEALTLPFQKSLDRAGSFAPDRVVLALDHETLANAERLAERESALVSTVFLGCWQALVARLTGRSHFIIHSLLDGRKQEELEGAVGLFAQAVPVPCKIEDQPFVEILRQTSETTEASARWLDYYSDDNPIRSIDFEFIPRATSAAADRSPVSLDNCTATQIVFS